MGHEKCYAICENKCLVETMPKPKIATCTDAKKTYYVKNSGSDTNIGTNSNYAFATIQRAIDELPKVLNHDVEIIVSMGTYNGFTISGFMGVGQISIIGGSNQTMASSYVLNTSVTVFGNSNMQINIAGFKNTTNENYSFCARENNGVVQIGNCIITPSERVGTAGIWGRASKIILVDCQINNRTECIRIDNLGELVVAGTLSGSNNFTRGTTYGGTIRVAGTATVTADNGWERHNGGHVIE